MWPVIEFNLQSITVESDTNGVITFRHVGWRNLTVFKRTQEDARVVPKTKETEAFQARFRQLLDGDVAQSSCKIQTRAHRWQDHRAL